MQAKDGVTEQNFRKRDEQKAGSASMLFPSSSIPQARRRLHRVPALLAEQKNRY